jgi:hypothetical protein
LYTCTVHALFLDLLVMAWYEAVPEPNSLPFELGLE